MCRAMATDSLIHTEAQVIECTSAYKPNKNEISYTCQGISANIMPKMIDISVGTTSCCTSQTQTELSRNFAKSYDGELLKKSLLKLEGIMEKELNRDAVPILASYWKFYNLSKDNVMVLQDQLYRDDKYSMDWDSESNSRIMPEIKIYQEIQLNTKQQASSLSITNESDYHGLATWLAVHCNNAPVLVVASTLHHHENWCEHVDLSTLHIYVPVRLTKNTSIIMYEDCKTVPLKACLCTLNTNPYNRTIFAGACLDGSIFVWQFISNVGRNDDSAIQIKELYHLNPSHDLTMTLDWSEENILMTAHNNGHVLQWHTKGQQLIEEADFVIHRPSTMNPCNISAFMCLNRKAFIVGSHDGGVFYCKKYVSNTVKYNIETIPLKRHSFTVSTLLKSGDKFNSAHESSNNTVRLISCDISGQVYLHDLSNPNRIIDTIVIELPMPFKSIIACSIKANLIYCLSMNSTIDCYSLAHGNIYTKVLNEDKTDGAIKLKGRFIKTSENGRWLVAGLQDNVFKIFTVSF